MAFQAFADGNDRNFSNPPVRQENSATNFVKKRSISSHSQRQHFHSDHGLLLKLPSLLTEADLQRYQPGDAFTYGLAYLQRPIALERHLPDANSDLAIKQRQSGKEFLEYIFFFILNFRRSTRHHRITFCRIELFRVSKRNWKTWCINRRKWQAPIADWCKKRIYLKI